MSKFTIALQDTVTFPVKLKFKQPDRTRVFDFTLTATRVSQERIKEEIEQKDRPIADFLQDVVKGWNGQRLVLLGEGEGASPADFSPDAFDAMLNVAGAPVTIWGEYLKAISPAKN